MKPTNMANQVLRVTCSLKINADSATTNTGVRDAILCASAKLK